MISQLEKEIIFRFLKARKKDGFLNVISIFSFIGISLGVAVLIIVMSVMNGFRTELINKIVGFNAHAVVKPYDKPLEFMSDKDFAKFIFSNDGEAVILSKQNTKGILLKVYLLCLVLKELLLLHHLKQCLLPNLYHLYELKVCRKVLQQHER